MQFYQQKINEKRKFPPQIVEITKFYQNIKKKNAYQIITKTRFSRKHPEAKREIRQRMLMH